MLAESSTRRDLELEAENRRLTAALALLKTESQKSSVSAPPGKKEGLLESEKKLKEGLLESEKKLKEGLLEDSRRREVALLEEVEALSAE